MIGFLQSNGPFIGGIAIATLLYLLIDLFIVIKDFGSILKAPSFWLLWLLTSTLNLLAFEALHTQSSSPGKQFGDAQNLALIIFSTVGTVAILQSFSLKIGDRKIVDVSSFIENLRATVLEDISRRVASSRREETSKTADKLSAAFKDRPAQLRGEFVRIMTFGNLETQEVQAQLTRIEQDADTLGVSSAMLLAQRIAKADVREANRLAWQAAQDTRKPLV
jgi:hypothetical protein